MIKTLTFLIILFPVVIFAQVSVTGKVISQADTKPVANANVFLSNATIGAHTADDGTFTLSNVKPGKYELVVSIIGFDTYNQTINVEGINISLPPITLFPKSIVLGQVTIRAERHDPDRQKNYALFEDELLGTGPEAKDCRIVNPQLLDLKYDGSTNTLTASSADFLEIENEGLGYRLKYFLKDFMLNLTDEGVKTVSYSGSLSFEKMKGSPSQEREWQRKRFEAYEGSAMHFLRSAVDNQLEQQGFRVMLLPTNPQRPADNLIQERLAEYQALKNNKAYRDSLAWWTKKSKLPKLLDRLYPVPLTNADIITGPGSQGLFTLSGAKGALYISYNKFGHFNKGMAALSDKNNTANSLIIFNGDNAIFDHNGALADPQSVTYDGVWSRGRLAVMLPLDYEPQQDNSEIDSLLEKKLDAKLNAYTGGHSEKAYLQFDKPYYTTGDTIYFKAYVTEGEKHTLTQQSGVLYADLLNGDNKVVKALRLQLTSGFAWGDFALPDTLKSGSYHLRAYTRWMRNAGESSFFDRELTIAGVEAKRIPEAGPAAAGNASSIVLQGRPDVQFFAEGGSLLAGVRAKIAFKALAPDGSGIVIKGTVTDEQGKQAGLFSSNALGMGAVELTPEAGKTYKAAITYADGSAGTINLPKTSAEGYALAVDNTGDEHNIKVTVSAARQTHLGKVSIVAQVGNTVYYAVKCAASAKGADVFIPKSELPTGVVRITLFSQSGEPLNERLAFINNNDLLKLELSAGSPSCLTRGQVKINLKAKDRNSQPVNGSFSVAVTDEAKVTVDEDTENNILTSLLLTSELKGAIEKPNYYFNSTNSQTTADLDLLMLTQGYRRFEWKQVLGDTVRALPYQPEKAIEISGMVKKGSRPFAGAKVTLFTTAGGSFLIDTLTNAEGRFSFKNLVFADSTKFVVQARVAKGQDAVTLDIDTLPPLKIVIASKKTAVARLSRRSEEVDMSAYVQNQKQFYIEQQKYGINKRPLMLKEVVVKDSRLPKELENSQNLNGKGNADQVITAKDLETLACGRLYDCLVAKLTGIMFLNNKMYVRRLTSLDPNSNAPPQPMQVMIDGMFVDYDLFHDLNPADVDAIEALMGPHYGAIYGDRGSYGIIFITTKHAHKTNNYYRYAPGVITYMPKGYYKAREFYSPQYDNSKTNQKMADLRSTIFWKPDIITDKDGNASFSYFNADGKGTYRMVIEGVDADGNLGRLVYRYEVK